MKSRVCNFVLCFLFILGCGNKERQIETESKSIITLLYNMESSFRFPPQPPPPLDVPSDSIKPVKLNPRDTIYKTDKFIVEKKYAIVFDNKDTIKSEDIKYLPEPFKEMVIMSKADKTQTHYFSPSNKMVLKDSIGERIPLIVIAEDQLRLEVIKERHNVVGVTYYSPIIFNTTFDNALLTFGAYRHGLDGSTAIYALKKVNGQWQVLYSKVISES